MLIRYYSGLALVLTICIGQFLANINLVQLFKDMIYVMFVFRKEKVLYMFIIL